MEQSEAYLFSCFCMKMFVFLHGKHTNILKDIGQIQLLYLTKSSTLFPEVTCCV